MVRSHMWHPGGGLVAAVLSGWLVCGPAAAATFRFGDVAITVPEGFTVERAAAPPLVERPVSLACDDDGALYASDSSGSNSSRPIRGTGSCGSWTTTATASSTVAPSSPTG